MPKEFRRGQGIEPVDFKAIRKPYTQFQTWLGETKGVEGCPANCRYCFFQLDGQTPKRPAIGFSPQEVIDLLAQADTYHPGMPVHFGSQTDAFSTKTNIDYYSELLKRYGNSDYANPVIFISKRSIPDSFMRIASSIKQKVIFYMSYSGLAGSSVEPTISSSHIKDNFVRLKAHGLSAVHYWRPFLPQNSTKQKINEILDFVSRFATCSVINGLRLNDGIRNNIASFWPELKSRDYDFTQTGEFWPQGVRNYLSKLIKEKYPMYPVFFGNTPCSITYALETSDTAGLLNGRMCQESQCLLAQRSLCAAKKRTPSIEEINKAATEMEIDLSRVKLDEDKIIVNGAIDSGKIVYLKTKLRFPIVTAGVTYEGGHNWANVRDDTKIIEIPWENNLQ